MSRPPISIAWDDTLPRLFNDDLVPPSLPECRLIECIPIVYEFPFTPIVIISRDELLCSTMSEIAKRCGLATSTFCKRWRESCRRMFPDEILVVDDNTPNTILWPYRIAQSAINMNIPEWKRQNANEVLQKFLSRIGTHVVLRGQHEKNKRSPKRVKMTSEDESESFEE